MITSHLSGVLLTVIAALLLPALVRAQSGKWDERFGPAPKTEGEVYAVAVDGNDVYVAGTLSMIDNVTVQRIAMWDGDLHQWVGLGGGVNGTVNALKIHDGRLYVGGSFSRAGDVAARGIAVWDTREELWSSIGDTNALRPMRWGAIECHEILVEDALLLIGGRFHVPDSLQSFGIARWDAGSQRWTGLGGGVDSSSTVVSALLRIGGDLFVGGNFRWVGTRDNPLSGVARLSLATETWGALGGGVPGMVGSMVEYDSSVIVAGSFRLDGRYNLARWNLRSSTWQSLDTGVGDYLRFASTLALDGDVLYVGIDYNLTSAIIPSLYRFNLREGSSRAVEPYPSSGINALVASGGRLHVGGVFTRIGNQPMAAYAQLDIAANRWENIARQQYVTPNWNVLSILPDLSGKVYVGGGFQSVGLLNANNIALWDGATWESLDWGVNGQVRAMALRDDDLYVGGEFTSASGVSAPYLSRWSRATRTWSAVGDQFDAPISSIVIGPAGRIYVGGEFTRVGSMLARGVAYWDGSRWYALGVGAGNGVEGTVRSMVIIGNYLYVGGSFASAGGDESITHLARWDLTSLQWLPLGDGVDNAVTALHDFGGSLIVGGPFERAGSIVARGVARWDGAKWDTLGSGLQGSRSVYAFVNHGNLLVAGGGFLSAGTAVARRIAVFDGEKWHQIGGGMDSVVRALASAGGDLYVGGEFTHADTVESRFMAIWHGTAASIDTRILNAGATALDLDVVPNPVPDRGSVRLRVTRRTDLRVVIIDVIGVERRVLYDGVLEPGERNIIVQADDLPGGVYYLQATTVDGDRTVRRIILK